MDRIKSQHSMTEPVGARMRRSAKGWRKGYAIERGGGRWKEGWNVGASDARLELKHSGTGEIHSGEISPINNTGRIASHVVPLSA